MVDGVLSVTQQPRRNTFLYGSTQEIQKDKCFCCFLNCGCLDERKITAISTWPQSLLQSMNILENTEEILNQRLNEKNIEMATQLEFLVNDSKCLNLLNLNKLHAIKLRASFNISQLQQTQGRCLSEVNHSIKILNKIMTCHDVLVPIRQIAKELKSRQIFNLRVSQWSDSSNIEFKNFLEVNKQNSNGLRYFYDEVMAWLMDYISLLDNTIAELTQLDLEE